MVIRAYANELPQEVSVADFFDIFLYLILVYLQSGLAVIYHYVIMRRRLYA